ncbi:MAG TPA: hypothetical protein VH592_14375 [Gemmataceae bacterium]|jgi:hypothetical protein
MAKAPYIALWASLLYLVVALAVTGKLCLDSLRQYHRGAAEATEPFSVMSPSWVIVTTDAAVERLWWLLTAVGLGILLLAMSAVWVSASGTNKPS